MQRRETHHCHRHALKHPSGLSDAGWLLNPTPERDKGEGDDVILLPALVPQVSELTSDNISKGNLEFLRCMTPW